MNKKTSDTNIFQEAIDMGYREESANLNGEEFFKVIEARRSIRVFLSDPIPEDVMYRCLDSALLAPNSSNLQPWEFYWVRSKKKKQQVVKACLSQPAAATAAEIVVCVARLDTWERNRKLMLEKLQQQESEGIKVPKAALHYYQKLVPMAYGQGPLGIYGPIKAVATNFLGIKNPTPREPKSFADMRVWAHKSCALACENLMLAMTASGFDTCPMEGLDSARMKNILNLSGKAEIVMAIGCGKRDVSKVYGPRVRFSKDLFVFEV